MKQEEIANALQDYAGAKNRHDLEEILSLCTEDSFYESVALGSRIQGKDSLRAFYSAFFAALPDYYGEFDGAAYGEDCAVVWGRFGGTLSGDFMGVDVEAGRQIEIPVTFVCTFQDGLLAGDTGYFDVATLAEQLGVPLGTLQPAADAGGAAAAALLANFTRLWETKDPEIVREMVTPDAIAHWSGLEAFDGNAYPERMRFTMRELVPDIELKVTGDAVRGDLVFISWRATGTVGGERLEWHGIDRFHLRGDLADEVYAVYDTAPFQRALENASSDPSVPPREAVGSSSNGG